MTSPTLQLALPLQPLLPIHSEAEVLPQLVLIRSEAEVVLPQLVLIRSGVEEVLPQLVLIRSGVEEVALLTRSAVTPSEVSPMTLGNLA